MKTQMRDVFCAALVVLGCQWAGIVKANDITYAETVFNTDYTTAGIGGVRTIGTGTIVLSGVIGPVTKAYLYWHGPSNSSDPHANASITVNGIAVRGDNIGTSNDNCWGFENSHAYRADVTSIVAGNGNYALADLIKTGVEINGASLIVFFNDGDPSNNRDVVMFHGNDSNIANPFDALGWNVTLSGIDYTSGSAALQLHVSDGQEWADDDLILNATVLAAGPEVFQGDSVPSAGGNNNGFLWDIKTYDVTAYLSPGLNTLTMTTGTALDCLSLIVAIIDLPAGAAPPPPPPPPENNCPLSQGFWKNHENAWPVSGLALGGQPYTQAELLAILNAPTGGKNADARLILAKQLIAALLNIENDSNPVPIQATVDAAQLLLAAAAPLPGGPIVKPNSALGKQMITQSVILDSYNNGELTPEDCPEEELSAR
jgi:hypothetical protein